METIDLDPRYSTSDVPGRCVKCLAEQKLNNCLFELLRGEGDEKELVQRFEMLVSFLKSPESQKLRAESERYLSDLRGRRLQSVYTLSMANPDTILK